jgi:hypothetical protein
MSNKRPDTGPYPYFFKFLIAMHENPGMNNDKPTPDHSLEPAVTPSVLTEDRQYEQSGLYPEGQKPFRVIALLGVLAGIIVFIAISAIVLDRLLVQ